MTKILLDVNKIHEYLAEKKIEPKCNFCGRMEWLISPNVVIQVILTKGQQTENGFPSISLQCENCGYLEFLCPVLENTNSRYEWIDIFEEKKNKRTGFQKTVN